MDDETKCKTCGHLASKHLSVTLVGQPAWVQEQYRDTFKDEPCYADNCTCQGFVDNGEK